MKANLIAAVGSILLSFGLVKGQQLKITDFIPDSLFTWRLMPTITINGNYGSVTQNVEEPPGSLDRQNNNRTNTGNANLNLDYALKRISPQSELFVLAGSGVELSKSARNSEYESDFNDPGHWQYFNSEATYQTDGPNTSLNTKLSFTTTSFGIKSGWEWVVT